MFRGQVSLAWSVVSPSCLKYVLTNTSILHHTNQPPIAVAVIKKYHRVTLCSVGLPVDCCDKVVKSVDEFEVDILCST